MSDATFQWELEGNIFDAIKQIKKDVGDLNSRVGGIDKTSKSAFGSLKSQIKSISLVSVTQQFENLTTALNDVNGPGMRFESSLAELSAITGQTGDNLERLGEMARQNAKDFGGDAASSVETYKLLLSQLGPQLAETPEILNQMARNSETLAKTMGGDVVGATEVLTTAMNQYNVDTSNAAEANKVMNEMMNSMAASAKEGSSELPVLQQAVKVVGGDAMRAGLQFEEMLAAIQLLDKAGKKGAEGGTALRNVLASLNQGRFLPKDVQEELTAAGVSIEALSDKSLSFTQRLTLLKDVSQDTALMSKLFGKENASSAQALIGSIDAQNEMTKAITGTNTAMDQANVIMETSEEKQKRLQAQIDDFKVTLFNATGGLFAYLEPLADLGRIMTALAPLGQGAIKVFNLLRKTKLANAAASKILTVATKAWNLALNMNPIMLIVTGAVALTGAVYALTKAISAGSAAQKIANETQERALEQTADERVELDMLFDQLKRTNKGSEERIKLVKELEQKYPDILEKYDLEKASLKEIEQAHNDVAVAVMKKARAEVSAEILKEKTRELMDQQAGPGIVDNVLGFFTPGVTGEQLNQLDVMMAEREVEAAKLNALAHKYINDGKEVSLDKFFEIFHRRKEITASGKVKTQRAGDVEGTESDENNASDNIKGLGTSKPKSYNGAGSQMKNINVRIDNVIGSLTIENKNIQESKAAIRRHVTEAIVGGVRDFEVAID